MTTPIDPTDGEAMGRIAYENNTILPGTIGTPATWDEMERWPEERIPWMSSGLAVARAVVPEGFAVYDTRTHVVVPAKSLASDHQIAWLDAIASDMADNSLMCQGGRSERWSVIRRALDISVSKARLLIVPATSESEATR